MPRFNDNRRGNPGRGGHGGGPPPSAQPCEPPYHFIPVAPELAVSDSPVFHDVQQTGEDAWSGELRCTLEALTPLLVGNYQFDYQSLARRVKDLYATLL